MNRSEQLWGIFAAGSGWRRSCGDMVIGAGVARAGGAGVHDIERSKIRMLQDKVQPRNGSEYVYENKPYLCCPMSVTAFEREPERYSKAQDQVTGQLVNKATAPTLADGDRVFFFESADTRAGFAKNPDRYMKPTMR